MDAQMRGLLGQGVGQALHRELGGVVIAAAGEADQPTDGGKVDDAPLAPGAHARQHRLGHGDEPEHIGLEHGPDFGVLALLDGGEIAVAGIVHQHVDPAEASLGLAHDGRHLAGHVDVQRGDQRRFREGFEFPQGSAIPGGHHRPPAPGQDAPGQVPAEAGGTAGDEPNLRVSHDNLPYPPRIGPWARATGRSWPS